jgi:hypothetical protein
MIEDRELDTWRQQWGTVGEPLPDIHRQIQKRIKRQNLRFLADNLSAAVTFVAGVVFAVFVVRQQPDRLGITWAAGICIFMLVCAGYRLWLQRGTWRPETQSTRAFVELWEKRLTAKLRLLRLASYLVVGWIAFVAVSASVNREVVALRFKAHPAEQLAGVAASCIVVPASLFWLAWYRRRKLAELEDVKRLLAEMNG